MFSLSAPESWASFRVPESKKEELNNTSRFFSENSFKHFELNTKRGNWTA